jgi:hypothetical protein
LLPGRFSSAVSKKPFAAVWPFSSGIENRLPQCFLPSRSLKSHLPHGGKHLPDAKVVCHTVASSPEIRGRFAALFLRIPAEATPMPHTVKRPVTGGWRFHRPGKREIT